MSLVVLILPENRPNGASRAKRGFPSPLDERECITFDAPSLLMATVSSHPAFGIHLADANATPFILAEAFDKIKDDISLEEDGFESERREEYVFGKSQRGSLGKKKIQVKQPSLWILLVLIFCHHKSAICKL